MRILWLELAEKDIDSIYIAAIWDCRQSPLANADKIKQT